MIRCSFTNRSPPRFASRLLLVNSNAIKKRWHRGPSSAGPDDRSTENSAKAGTTKVLLRNLYLLESLQLDTVLEVPGLANPWRRKVETDEARGG